jgi:hypothetical protein
MFSKIFFSYTSACLQKKQVFFINKVSLIKYSGTAQSALERIEKGTRQVVCNWIFCSSILTVAKFIVSDWADKVNSGIGVVVMARQAT